MTAKELADQLKHMMEQFPECASREVKIFGPHGRTDFDEVALSITSNIWLIEK